MAIGPLITIPSSYDYKMIPSNRPLYAVLEDVVRHGVDNPRHGTDCACMDRFVYELRAHINRALPEVEYRIVELYPEEWHEPGDERVPVPESVHAHREASFRIAHVLELARRRL